MGLRFRRVTGTDRQRVARICARTWHGWDYVMVLFDRWKHEPGFIGAERNGRLVGFGKATELAPGEWWMEGLRMDPRHRGKGIATRLSDVLLDWTLGRNPRSVRLATATKNVESMRIIERMGFRVTFRSNRFRGGPPEPGAGRRLSRVRVGEARRFLEGAQELVANRGLLSYTWHFRELTRDYLSELARAGALYGHRSGRVLDGLMILRPHRYDPKNLEISYLGGSAAALRAFRAEVARQAQGLGTETVQAMGASTEMGSALGKLGLERHPRPRRVLVYEYPV